LAAAESFCATPGVTGAAAIWWPDLRVSQVNTTLAIKVRF
jgi:hypothetical protein